MYMQKHVDQCCSVCVCERVRELERGSINCSIHNVKPTNSPVRQSQVRTSSRPVHIPRPSGWTPHLDQLPSLFPRSAADSSENPFIVFVSKFILPALQILSRPYVSYSDATHITVDHKVAFPCRKFHNLGTRLPQ